jgi:hypothetical protein
MFYLLAYRVYSSPFPLSVQTKLGEIYQQVYFCECGRLRQAFQVGTCALFIWLISHQPAVLFSQNKSATNNQPTVLFSHNKLAPAIGHQPSE